MAAVEDFYRKSGVIHHEGCSVCVPIEGYRVGGIVITGINGVSIIEVDATYNFTEDQPAPFSLLQPSLKEFGVSPVIQSSPFVPPIDDFRLRNPLAVRPKWWQFRKRRRWSRMPKVTDGSIAAILRKLPKYERK